MGPRTPKHTCVQMSFAGHSPSWELGRAAGTQTTSEHPQSRDSAPLPGCIDPYRWDPEGFTRVNKTLVNAEPRGSALTPRPGDPGHGNYRCKSPGAASPPTQNGSRKGWCMAPTLASCSQPGPEHPPHRSRAGNGGCGSKWARGTAPQSPASRGRIRPRVAPLHFAGLAQALSERCRRTARPRNVLRARPECPARRFMGEQASPTSGHCH